MCNQTIDKTVQSAIAVTVMIMQNSYSPAMQPFFATNSGSNLWVCLIYLMHLVKLIFCDQNRRIPLTRSALVKKDFISSGQVVLQLSPHTLNRIDVSATGRYTPLVHILSLNVGLCKSTCMFRVIVLHEPATIWNFSFRKGIRQSFRMPI